MGTYVSLYNLSFQLSLIFYSFLTYLKLDTSYQINQVKSNKRISAE